MAVEERPISVVSTYAFVNPVVAVALGTVFLNEKISWSRSPQARRSSSRVVLIVTLRTPKKQEVVELSEPLKAAA